MRILFADDSMTAQNMGKKILTEAGYEVVAVSNGAAAVKKIAEQKPDIIILDIYMPGYTGLEVCDKVRASIETLKTPVLLTVGKMEPYRAEDANRVKADGVIIKPFEASDLLAVIRRLEERVVPKTNSAVTEQTVMLERPPDFTEFPTTSDNHRDGIAEPNEYTVQATVDVPDNMATAAAFSDLLGPESAHSPDSIPFTPQASAVEFGVFPEVTVESPASTPESASSVEVESAPTAPPTLPAHDATANAAEPGPNSGWDPAASASYSASDFGMDLGSVETAPASSEIEEEREAVEAEPVAAIIPEITETPRDDVHHLKTNNASAISSPVVAPVEETVAPPHTQEDTWQARAVKVDSVSESSTVYASAMLPAPEIAPKAPTISVPESANAVEIDSFSAQIEEQIQRIETIVSASEARHMEAEASVPAENAPTGDTNSREDDFDARVAAAMSIYDGPTEDHASPSSFTEIDTDESPVAVNEQHTSAAPASVELPYSFEYTPPITSPEREPAVQPLAKTAAPAESEEFSYSPTETAASVDSKLETTEVAPTFPAANQTSPHEVAHFQRQPIPVEPEAKQVEEAIKSEIDAQLPAASVAAAVSPAADDDRIASAVHRVLERLKPHLIQEISRELNTKRPPEEG